MIITYEEWMSPRDLDSGDRLDCYDDPPCPLMIEGRCAIRTTYHDISLDNFREACHKIALLRESSGFRLRTPPPDNRKRVPYNENTPEGDYRTDVDEGIAEEVRILNEELGLETWSSCEGHLSEFGDDSACISCYIDDKTMSEIMNKLVDIEIKSVKTSKNKIRFRLDTDEYVLVLDLDSTLERNNKSVLSIIVEPNNPDIPWYIWDKIRGNGFKQAIEILENSLG